jgi:AraC family transcriptional regulator of adaptative response/methylated-DNA-[protein]-cysteine methyltransferase
VRAVVERIRDPRGAAARIPLDVNGTAFQQRVWKALRDIPVGETRSYREVAESIGQPTAARAVARACATNHIAVVIPCHRVVAGDGAVSGYRWGVERKKTLLEQEK